LAHVKRFEVSADVIVAGSQMAHRTIALTKFLRTSVTYLDTCKRSEPLAENVIVVTTHASVLPLLHSEKGKGPVFNQAHHEGMSIA